MDKKKWINEKVKRIMEEGVRYNTHAPISSSNLRRPVSPFQAAAIAHSMYTNRNKKKKVVRKRKKK